ncbi:MAG TPA: tRNA epoxyqueuosine(34) reductase QueG [Saprospiraceae bacterium]|nr:tRNA epoxyqueuosine(34) reductase QueG [Saprospiraceae bacterium]HMQ85159.1 tRNA epoxyqueuosine(34) reductase QueG [Saprospiraceae bacterium]
MTLQDRSWLIETEAKRLGFSFVGIARAEHMDEEARRLEQWLNGGHHGQMAYMANHFDKRTDPRKLVEGARSVISLMYNYYTEAQQEDATAPKISKYAFGKDYHGVIKSKLRSLLEFINREIGEVSGRCFVDSAPVLERDWARRSGLGWMGKNTMLIHPKAGSYFFLAELIVDLELAYEHQPMKDFCGTCRRCIDACPTAAISPQGYLLDASRCISYFTIELRDALPDAYKGQFDNWMFGCDICQDVCPWNRFSKPHQESEFEPSAELMGRKKEEWEDLTEEVFRQLFRHSAVKRTGFKGLKRNIQFLKEGENR